VDLTSVAIQHDSKGQLRGSGSALVQVGADVVAANYNVNGSVSGGGQDTRAKFTVKLKGRDSIAGEIRSFNITLKYDLFVVAEDLLLVGTLKGNASYSGLGNSDVSENVEFPLPDGVDGSWAVVMNLLLLNKKLAGTGAFLISTFQSPDLPVGFPEERELPADVRGNYKPETDIAKVNVKGVGEGSGSNVKLEFQTDALMPSFMKGKVLGQRVQIGQGD
jgi:hypothetical protein